MQEARSALRRSHVLLVLRHEFAPESLGQDGLIEFRQETRCIAVLGSDAVEPGKGCFDAADTFLLLLNRRQWNVEVQQYVLVQIYHCRTNSMLFQIGDCLRT